MATYQSKFTGEEIDGLLEKMQNGEVIGGGMTYAKLNTDRIEGTSTTHTLKESVFNYDLLLVEADLRKKDNGEQNRKTSMVIIPQTIDFNITYRYRLECDSADHTKDLNWRTDIKFGFTDATTVVVGDNTVGSAISSSRTFGIDDIYGIKFGGGGSSTRKVTLWEGELKTDDESVTLSDSLENYDFILIESCITDKTGSKGAYMTNLLDVNTIKTYNSAGFNMFTSADPTKHWYRVSFNFTNATTLQLMKANVSSTSWINPQISKVIGIKY